MKNMTSKELKEMGKNLKVKNWWKLGKAELIEEIEKIQNESDEAKAAREEEINEEKKLVEHYMKNWQKYGQRNNVSKFIEDYRAGKITLIDEISSNEEKLPEINSGASEETIEEIVGQDSLEDQEKDEKSVPIPDAEKSEELKKKAEYKEKKSRGAKGKQIEFNGKSQNLDAWARELGFIRQTLYARLYIQGWDVEKAFTTPGRKVKEEV